MKLCFPVNKNEGLQSQIFGHFGSAPLLLVVDTENQEIIELRRSAHAEQSGRTCMGQLLGEGPIDALVVSAIGRGAFSRVQASGIKVYQALGSTIADNLLCLTDQRLKEFDGSGLCSHGQSGHQHRQHGHDCSCH